MSFCPTALFCHIMCFSSALFVAIIHCRFMWNKQVCKQGAAEVWLEVDGLRFRGFKRVQNRLCPAQLGRGAWIYTNILVGYSWSSPPTAVGTSGLATLKTPRIPCCSGKHGKTREISQNCGSREEKFHASALTWEFGHPKNS